MDAAADDKDKTVQRIKGRLTTWDDARGYGFLMPMTGGQRLFVHARAFVDRSRRPVVGDIVTCVIGADARGRPCAEAATLATGRSKARPRRRAAIVPMAVAFGAVGILSVAAITTDLPAAVPLLVTIASVVTWLAYAIDKRAAEQGRWRTSEGTLHLLALVGGWPGALLAQQQFRHKTRKQPFQGVFRVLVVLNIALLGWLAVADVAAPWRVLLGSVL